MAKHDPPEGDYIYDFCSRAERKRFYEDVLVAYDELRKKLESEGKAKRIGDVRLNFFFTNDQGLETMRRYKSFDKLENFLLWTPQYGKESGRKKPDWSTDGLCQYAKKFVIGTAKLRGDREIGFDEYREFHGE